MLLWYGQPLSRGKWSWNIHTHVFSHVSSVVHEGKYYCRSFIFDNTEAFIISATSFQQLHSKPTVEKVLFWTHDVTIVTHWHFEGTHVPSCPPVEKKQQRKTHTCTSRVEPDQRCLRGCCSPTCAVAVKWSNTGESVSSERLHCLSCGTVTTNLQTFSSKTCCLTFIRLDFSYSHLYSAVSWSKCSVVMHSDLQRLCCVSPS